MDSKTNIKFIMEEFDRLSTDPQTVNNIWSAIAEGSKEKNKFYDGVLSLILNSHSNVEIIQSVCMSLYYALLCGYEIGAIAKEQLPNVELPTQEIPKEKIN